MFGWRPSPEALLRERCRVGEKELRRNARRQQDLEAAVDKLTAMIKQEKDINKRKTLCGALIQKKTELQRLVDSAQRTRRTLDTMERSKETSRRLDDTNALAASMSSMARRASPVAIARTQEMIMTAQASLEMTEDILDDIDRPDSEVQQSMEDQVANMLEQIDSEDALEVTSSMPSAAIFPAIAFPAVASSSSSSSDPPPTVSLESIEERLSRLMNT